MSYEKIYEKYRNIGSIHSEIKKELLSTRIIGMNTSELINIIENKIRVKSREKNIQGVNDCIAFPVGISVNNCCAHWTYSDRYNDITIGKNDLVKIDFGINNTGFIVDSAISVLTNPENDLHTSLVEASNDALNKAISLSKPDQNINEIGCEIQEIIESYDFKPIKNLCGHQILPFKIHAGKCIPNISFNYNQRMKENEIYAIEPFVTNGNGNTYEDTDNTSHFCINYNLSKEQRELLIITLHKNIQFTYNCIYKNFRTLPFCDRWLSEILQEYKLDNGFNLWQNLKELKKYNVLNWYPPIYDINKDNYVSQMEHTVLIREGSAEILT